MKKNHTWLASELARQTKNNEDEAGYMLGRLREIARFEPGVVCAVLGLAVDQSHVMPPLGICLPCEWVSCRDGDTVNIRLRTGQQIGVKLMDCHIPDRNTKGCLEANHFLESLFEQDGPLRAWFPLVDENDVHKLVHILQSFAFELASGRIFIGTEDVSEIMVQRGFATREEPV